MEPRTPSDEALLLSGDPEDFGRFYDRHVDSLLAYFQRRTLDPEVAADLTAETFAAALVARTRFQRRETPAAAWLFTIAQRRLADHGRRGRTEDRMRRRLRMERIPLSAEDASVIRMMGDEVAYALVAELPAPQREAVRAHVIDDRSYEQIAHMQHTTAATARQRVSRGLRSLRDKAGGAG